MFLLWLTTEQFVFLGSIASGILYMTLRSCTKQVHEMYEELDHFSEKTDHLQANHISIEMNESYFTVLFTSYVLLQDPEYELRGNIKLCVYVFFAGQVV